MEFTEELDKKISAVLLRTGIKPHYKGYRMLKDAIKLVMQDPSMIAAQSKKLYPTLGKNARRQSFRDRTRDPFFAVHGCRRR